MPPKQSKADVAKKQKIIEDKTFGLKNKNKSKNVQNLKQSVQPKPDASKVAAKKEEEKAKEKEPNELFKIAVSQPKVPVGVDPKSILCEFFKAGQCTKGFKCKFSHDLNVQRKGEKIDIYSDKRDDGTMEDWYQREPESDDTEQKVNENAAKDGPSTSAKARSDAEDLDDIDDDDELDIGVSSPTHHPPPSSSASIHRSPSMADTKKRRRANQNSDELPFKNKLKPDSSILESLKDFSTTSTSSSSSKTLTLQDLSLPFPCREVSDLSLASVQSNIETLVLKIAQSILSGNGFSFDVPSRAAANQHYVSELDRIVLKDKTSLRPFANISTVRKSAITTRILQLVHQLCIKGIHVTKRDLFYTDVKLFQDQLHSDAVLDDVSCMLGCTRSSLNVVAAEKGVVVGRLIFSDNGDMIDCTKMGMGGKAIPPNIDRVGDMQSDALFILLVEKDAAYMRLAEDRFYNRFPCIIVTAKGQPDVATRLFLRKMRTELKLPVLALVDSDPYGLKILSVYGCGSKNMSYDSGNLTTPDIKWLGVRPSDLDKYKIPEQCRLPMTEQDIKTGKDMLEEDFVKKNPGWVEELTLMVKTKQKAEIQALSTFGFQYLSEVYLPLKLQQKDWL